MLINGIGGDDLFGAPKPRARISPVALATVDYAGPRGGGWGQGELASAGTLMLGDKPSVAKAPSLPLPARPLPKAAVAAAVSEDLGMVDMEDCDVDTLINEEMENGGLNADLAAKLKAFEAMADDDE
eukprot:362227-Chlamydomonas_euryale.AAC.1